MEVSASVVSLEFVFELDDYQIAEPTHASIH